MKDWIGNKESAFAQIGATGHSKIQRPQNDFYSTDPNSLRILLKALKRDNLELHNNIWECACGQGALSEVLEKRGYNVVSSDLIYRGYGIGNVDFLAYSTQEKRNGDILTNPPYKYAKEFVEKALDLVEDNCYVIMFLKIQFLEGKERRKLFEKYPPKYVYVNSSRQLCYLNGNTKNKINSATCYCWFIWQKGYKDEPIIRWI